MGDLAASDPAPAPTQVDIDDLQQRLDRRLDRLTQIVSEIGAERRR